MKKGLKDVVQGKVKAYKSVAEMEKDIKLKVNGSLKRGDMYNKSVGHEEAISQSQWHTIGTLLCPPKDKTLKAMEIVKMLIDSNEIKDRGIIETLVLVEEIAKLI